jgi:hypothetical protein
LSSRTLSAVHARRFDFFFIVKRSPMMKRWPYSGRFR